PETGFQDIWSKLFTIAECENNTAQTPCQLVPFWHTETIHDIKIERFVPLYPYSKDIDKYKNLLRVLAFYRLTFGQPRQEELIEALATVYSSEEAADRFHQLLINLSPITY
ncbi:MAG: hypothetical protein AABZ46_00875, partial [Nitrospirota bacterium]